MSTTMTCDHCGEVIAQHKEQVQLRVSQPGWLSGQLEQVRRGITLPERIDVSLDLHLKCYAAHYQPAIERPRP